MYLKLRILQFWKFLDVRGRRLNNKRKETRPHIGQSRRRIESNRIDERGRVVLAAAASLLRPASVERRSVSRERARFRAKGWLSSLVNEEATKPPKLSASFPPFSLSLSLSLSFSLHEGEWEWLVEWLAEPTRKQTTRCYAVDESFF